jgi:hypothetical protein
LTPSEKASPGTDKTPEGTATCAMLDVCWILRPQMLAVCDNGQRENSTAAQQRLNEPTLDGAQRMRSKKKPGRSRVSIMRGIGGLVPRLSGLRRT